MTDHPRLEVPFDVVAKWEEIEGSCARFYAAAEWGYKKGLKEQRSILIRALADQVVPEGGAFLSPGTAAEIRADILAIATELESQ